ncbi:hypothetical protein PSH58_10995 [Pseudomonas hefeiensis]|uniref:Twin-arginine translocation signal domain-containing protein n=1 Tax=Pseudomonas hefeiensis TaxID=2738125 RepID=A0ABY9GGR3_9PSED|nr:MULTISPECIES: hypothetical protein [unclassified Pseudomonas]WLH14789.1 hypothetical protein PSH57_10975 [Pseudomonas sp. FP205]WLH97840.1 hypothetical protein PSH58_10995 [Pseudomonas sp. FP53]WLI42115.1 hypothetical protein PSH74_10960 [Pseudomonas sp. FP821]
MINRRTFLGASLGAGAVSVMANAAALPFHSYQWSAKFHSLLVDQRSVEGLLFARAARSRGLLVTPVEDDVTAFWVEHLHQRWHLTQGVIAGLTSYSVLICLGQLARDHGMRLVYQGEHHPLGAQGIRHTLEGAPTILATVADVRFSDAWPHDVLDLLSTNVKSSPHVSHEKRSFEGPGRMSVSMYSWLIVPRTV